MRTTRDGFDTKHELTKLLFAELEKRLAPIYRREEERFNKGFEAVPTAVRQRISEALKELNRLLREVAGEGDDGGGDGTLDRALPLQFLPRQTRLFVGKPRRVRLFFQKALASKSGATVHLRPAFGAIRSDRFSRDAVQLWVRARADEIVEGDFAPKTFNNVLNCLSSVLVWARRQGYLGHDPLDGIDRLPKVKTERAYLEPAQIDRLLVAAAARPPADTLLRLACFSGLRRGELFALRWEDIDWGDGQDGGQVHVRRSIYKGDITSPKTPAGIRKVDVPGFILEDLRLHQMMVAGQPGDRLFRSPTGGVLDPDHWSERVLKPILEAAGLPSSFGLHGLRHTYASLLINQGESIKYVSKQLGHASIQITADLYGHLFRETSTAAMRRLGADTARRGELANGLLTRLGEPEKRAD